MEKQELLQKVFKLFHKYGIKSVTMDDISKTFGISKKTLYEWVTDKEHLIEQVLTSKHEYIKQDYWTDSPQTALDKAFNIYAFIITILKNYNPSIIYDLKKYYPVLYAKIQQKQRTNMLKKMQQNLQQGIKEGIYREDLNVVLISHLHLLSIESIHNNDLLDDISPVDLFREMFKFYLRAIAKPNKLQLIDKTILKLEKQFNF